MHRSASLLLAVLLGACITSTGGPEADRPERLEFIPAPATAQELEGALAGGIGPGLEVVEGSIQALGKYPGPQGPLVYGRFAAVDTATGEPQECFAYAAPFQSSVGCGPASGPSAGDVTEGAVDISGSGSDGTWSDAEFRVTDDVAELVAVADDGTTYRIVPIGSFAWMEWRAEHGNLTVRALDDSNNLLETVEVVAGPE